MTFKCRFCNEWFNSDQERTDHEMFCNAEINQQEEIEIDLGNVKTHDIFKELKDLKRHNIVGKIMEKSKTGHYVSYDDVLRLFHKYWGK